MQHLSHSTNTFQPWDNVKKASDMLHESTSKVKCVCLSTYQFNAESQSMCIHAYVHLHFMQCVEVPSVHTQHAWSTCNFCGWCNSFSLNAPNFHALEHFSNPSLSSSWMRQLFGCSYVQSLLSLMEISIQFTTCRCSNKQAWRREHQNRKQRVPSFISMILPQVASKKLILDVQRTIFTFICVPTSVFFSIFLISKFSQNLTKFWPKS